MSGINFNRVLVGWAISRGILKFILNLKTNTLGIIIFVNCGVDICERIVQRFTFRGAFRLWIAGIVTFWQNFVDMHAWVVGSTNPMNMAQHAPKIKNWKSSQILLILKAIYKTKLMITNLSIMTKQIRSQIRSQIRRQFWEVSATWKKSSYRSH